MAKVLVLFHSRMGTTAALADAIAEGARSVRFTEVDVRRLEDLAPESVIAAQPDAKASRDRLRAQYRTLADANEVADCDALVLGAPTRHGVMAAELARFLDTLGPLGATGALADTVGSAFTGVPARRGGHELTLQSIMASMCELGMILAPPGYTDPVMREGGSPYGATTTGDAAGPTEADLAAARHQGARVARIAGWVRHAKGHEAGHSHSHSHEHSHGHSHEGGHHHHH